MRCGIATGIAGCMLCDRVDRDMKATSPEVASLAKNVAKAATAEEDVNLPFNKTSTLSEAREAG